MFASRDVSIVIHSRCASFYHCGGKKDGHHVRGRDTIVCDTRNPRGDCHEEPIPELRLGDEGPVTDGPDEGESARNDETDVNEIPGHPWKIRVTGD